MATMINTKRIATLKATNIKDTTKNSPNTNPSISSTLPYSLYHKLIIETFFNQVELTREQAIHFQWNWLFCCCSLFFFRSKFVRILSISYIIEIATFPPPYISGSIYSISYMLSIGWEIQCSIFLHIVSWVCGVYLVQICRL